MGSSGARRVAIVTEEIELGAFLKWARVAGSGGEAKSLVQAGLVKVNGGTETRRRRRLRVGDRVRLREGVELEVVRQA